MPARISDQVIEQVRQANDIVEVIGSYFPLKRAGANFRALCPFHKEKTPSFNVHPAKQIWHCFGCGEGGDVFKFVMKYESLDFLASVRRLAERAGIRIEWEEADGEPSRDQKELLLKLHEDVTRFFQEQLRSSDVAKKYLQKRRISAEAARNWRIGYSPDSWDALVQWARGKKYRPELLEAGGLVLPGERGQYDRFRGRLMFAICDEQGRVVGFSGRILTEAKDQPKYVNSPETPIFQKGKILFALDKARRSIIEEKFAIVCEGQLDTISCHEAGVTNIVAPQGTALTEQHARILKRYAEEVVLMFDADAAGQNAIVRSAEPLWQAGIVLRVAGMPAGHDPDSFVKELGPEKLKELITKAPSFFVYLLEKLSKEHDPDTERGKLQIVRQMVEWLVRVPSPTLLATYAQQTAARLDVPETVIRQELSRRRAAEVRTGAGTQAQVRPEEADADEGRQAGMPAELLLLQLMLTDDRSVDWVVKNLDRKWLSDSTAGHLIELALKLNAAGRWNGPQELMRGAAGEQSNRLISELLLKPQTPVDQRMKALADGANKLEREWAEREYRQLQKLLNRRDLHAEELKKIQRQMLDLIPKFSHIPALSMRKTDPSAR